MTANNFINPSDYTEFRQYLEEVSGIVLGENKEYLVSSRLRNLFKDGQFKTLGEVTQKIKVDGKFRETVVDAMTTNETLWFRDAHPFRIFREILLPEYARKQKSIKVWCAACSTGQEPYSLSIEIEEFKKKNPGALSSEKIVATDISTSALAIAKEGVYEKLTLSRGMPDNFLSSYFDEAEPGRWKIKPNIASRIEFRPMNLMSSYNLLGKFDVIFCRNVLIYFSGDMKKDILTRMNAVLNTNGYLMLGASESMSGLSDYYEMVQCKPGLIYRKNT